MVTRPRGEELDAPEPHSGIRAHDRRRYFYEHIAVNFRRWVDEMVGDMLK